MDQNLAYSFLILKNKEKTEAYNRKGKLIASSESSSETLQYAVDCLPISGGTILITAGNYLLERTVEIIDKNYVYFAGEGWGTGTDKTQINYERSGGAQLQAIKDISILRWSNDKLSKLDGGGARNLFGSGIGNSKSTHPVFDFDAYSNRTSFENVEAGHGLYGIKIGKNCDAPMVFNCGCQSNGSHGLYIKGTLYGPKVIGGEYSDNGNNANYECAGIYIEGGNGARISSVSLIRNKDYGIYAKNHRQLSIQQVEVEAKQHVFPWTTRIGIMIKNCPDTIINSSHISQTQDAGIMVDNCQNVNISSCILKNNIVIQGKKKNRLKKDKNCCIINSCNIISKRNPSIQIVKKSTGVEKILYTNNYSRAPVEVDDPDNKVVRSSNIFERV